ncbi:MAG TPA: GGDEF domain-containing protein, partial [Hyphomicrobium sp.]|nr:GGDEF domain-containing protein [Hyphomicrobium sp.]
LVIVDARGKATFSSEYGSEPPADKMAPLLAATSRLMERARVLYRTARAVGSGFDTRLPGAMVEGLYITDMINVGGRPSMITVSPFTPDVEDLDTPKEPTLLLGVQRLSPVLLDKLEALSHIDDIEQVRADHEETTGEQTHALKDSNGNVVAHLTWDFSSPGYAIFEAALPAITASLALIAMMTLFAAMTMRRMTRRLAESEQAAVYASRHDAATGLANRGWFMRVFTELIDPAPHQRSSSYAVMLIDCDHFKTINDTMGHAAGDAVLSAIAERLTQLNDRISIAARLGGDEFAVITTPLVHADEAAVLVRSIEVALSAAPVIFESHIIEVSVSIGAVTADIASELSIDAWLAKADLALYRAKYDGRGCSRLYDPALDSGVLPPASNSRNPVGERAAQGRAA